MDDSRAHVVMLIDSGRAAEAAELLVGMLAASPEEPALWVLEARARIALGQGAAALEAANRAARLSPADPVPHQLASVVLGNAGDAEGSSRAARESVRLGSEDVASWEVLCFALGRQLSALGQSGDRAVLPTIRLLSEEVLAAADRVVALGPTEASAWTARAFALAAARRPDLAEDAAARARQLSPPPVPVEPPPLDAEANETVSDAFAGFEPPAPRPPADLAPPPAQRPWGDTTPGPAELSTGPWSRRWVRVATVLVIVLTVGWALAIAL